MGGGDKCLRALGDKPILAHIAARARPQVATLVLNANGNAARFKGFDLPVAADVVDGFAGPLAGVLTGLEWALAHAPEARWVVSFATDAPFFPDNLVARLKTAADEAAADMACATSGGQAQPVFALWPVRLAGALRRAMIDEDMRKVDAWTGRYKMATADFSVTPVDPFFNVNRPEDLVAAEELAGILWS
jgi:molybdopterin-guanine dinucleotide biosynthesis protein A